MGESPNQAINDRIVDAAKRATSAYWNDPDEKRLRLVMMELGKLTTALEVLREIS